MSGMLEDRWAEPTRGTREVRTASTVATVERMTDFATVSRRKPRKKQGAKK